MRSDADNDTRSPWYDAFAPQATLAVDATRPVTGRMAAVEPAGAPEAAEPDGSTEALFDCYNA